MIVITVILALLVVYLIWRLVKVTAEKNAMQAMWETSYYLERAIGGLDKEAKNHATGKGKEE